MNTNIHGSTSQIKNIVLVHGAFADASGWRGVFDILKQQGYHVTMVQIPLSSLQDDVDATMRILDKQIGPVVLAGHSWGGTVITQAGNHDLVAALVYIAAFQPDNGETAFLWASKAAPAPENGIMSPDANGMIYYDEAKFHAGFCTDLSKEDADFMFASQAPVALACFTAPVTAAAWRNKPSYGVIATEDKGILPEVEREMYERSGSKITEVKGSHVIFISQPAAVAEVIMKAAKDLQSI